MSILGFDLAYITARAVRMGPEVAELWRVVVERAQGEAATRRL
jgi:hypothetical protein